MPTSTTNFSWQLPIPNSPVDANVWGTQLNGNLSAQDTQLLSAFTNNIGNTAPTSPVLTAGANWINTTAPTNWIYNVYDGSEWVAIGTIDPVAHTFTGFASVGLPNVRLFTSVGTTTYTPSVGLSYATIDGVGGGGGGAGGTSSYSVSSGGGSGGYFWTQLSASAIGAGQPVTIGSGGGGGSPGGGGSAGGVTTFGSILTANGGGGGGSGNGLNPGIGGSSSGGIVNITGSSGFIASSLGTGEGGPSPVFGQITPGISIVSGSNVGNSASGYGNGGSGGYGITIGAGGAGSSGIIRIVEYF